MTFNNRVTVSYIWNVYSHTLGGDMKGFPTLTGNHLKDTEAILKYVNPEVISSHDAEIMVWRPQENLTVRACREALSMEVEDEVQVMGYLTPEDVLKVLVWAEALP